MKIADRTVESGFYADIKPDLQRVTTERFGTIPARSTLGQYLATAETISQKMQRVVAWRGQLDISWGVHSSAARRVMFRSWINPSPDYLGAALESIDLGDHDFEELDERLRRDEVPSAVHRQLRSYEASLLDQARAAGHDIENNGHRLGDLELLGLLQHHDAATPPLDVSRNALVGLWFAAETAADTTGLVMGPR